MNYLVEFQVEKNEKTINMSIILSLLDFAINEKEMFGLHFDWFVKKGAINFFCNTNLETVGIILNSGCFNSLDKCKTLEEGLATMIHMETEKTLRKIDIILERFYIDQITYFNIEKIIDIH